MRTHKRPRPRIYLTTVNQWGQRTPLIEQRSYMRILPLLIWVALECVSPVHAQEFDVALEDLKWSAIVADEQATFTFPPAMRTEWSWYNADTPVDRLEYTWSISIGDEESGYEFGPSLFRFAEARTTNGTLEELLEICQHDLWQVSKGGGENIGPYGDATLIKGQVSVSVYDPKRMKLLFESKPKSVYMTITTPEFSIRQKVAVTYK